jgi:hypothetical protein
MTAPAISTELLEERMLFGQLARHDLLTFAKLNNPDPLDPFNPWKSRYTWKPHHELICNALQELEAGKIKALEVETPPRYSKSELTCRNFAPWHAGKHPEQDLIIVTATHELAMEHGRDVRDYMNGPGYKLVFGGDRRAMLRKDASAADRLQLVGGAKLIFVGRGGLPAGIGGFGIIMDDFFKSAEEACSLTEREKAWRSYIADCLSRLNNAMAWKLIIGSRKHGDDVQGRLFDPLSVHYDEASAKEFKRIRIPALSEGREVDPLGREKDEVCWPERFTKEFYLKKRNHASDIVRMDFQTQDQCNPVSEEGDYFKKTWLATYLPDELPQRLRFYGFSDHAYREKQKNDKNFLGVAGVDATDTIWIMPSCWWRRSATDEMVEEWISLMARHNTLVWWAARDAVSGSVGPFLRKRQIERRVFNVVDDSIVESKDLTKRAQSIRGRAAMGMVRFPKYAPWWGELEACLLGFPNAKEDDPIAALAILGMGLDKMTKATAVVDTSIKRGTWAWHTMGQEDRNKPCLAGW